jgi:hypothetical protein
MLSLVVAPTVSETELKKAGCQVCEWLFPGERVCWEVVPPRESPSTSYGALRVPDPAYCRDPEREVKHRWTVLVKVYTPGGAGMWGMRVRE